MKWDRKYIVTCDLETTGVDVHGCSWITGSFGGLETSTLNTIRELELESKPFHWDEEARYIHRISKRRALTFPDRKISLNRLIDFLPPKEDFHFCCHASSSHKSANLSWQRVYHHFDMAMIRMDFLHQDRHFEFYKYFDLDSIISTTTICREYYKHDKKFLLTDSCKALGIPMVGQHHNAKADRLGCESILRKYKNDKEGLFNERGRDPKLDTRIPDVQLDKGLEEQQRSFI